MSGYKVYELAEVCSRLSSGKESRQVGLALKENFPYMVEMDCVDTQIRQTLQEIVRL